MGKRGPKPAATAIKEANGSFVQHPGRRNLSEPKPKLGLPEKTPTILADPELEAIWDQIADQLDAMKILSVSDRWLIELASVTYHEMLEVKKVIDTEGRTVEGRNGSIRHPLGVTYRELKDSWRRLLGELGLTISSRTTLVASSVDEPDLLHEFLKEFAGPGQLKGTKK